MTTRRRSNIEDSGKASTQLGKYYLAKFERHRIFQKNGKKLVIIASLGILVMFLLCGGLFPAIFGNPIGVGVDVTNAMVQCQLSDEAPNIPGVKLDDLSQEQLSNAAFIVDVGKDMNIPKWGWVIAVATALQESHLRSLPNLGDRNDHDSIGLFQQRPSQGWGTEAQLIDPRYAASKFFNKLLAVQGWEQKRLTQAAQAVQKSAFPNAYQKWEQLAIDIVNELTKGDENSELQGNPMCAVPGVISASGWVVPTVGTIGSGFRTPSRPKHDGVDVIVPRGTAVRAASAGIVTTAECNASTGNCDVDGGPAVKGCGWYVEISHGPGLMTRYCHFGKRPNVFIQQRVETGQKIGEVGSSGNSSGPHLHFEVHVDDKPIDPVPFMNVHGAPLKQ